MNLALSKSNWHTGSEGVSQCQNSLDSDSDTPPEGAAIRILLGEAASRHLDAAGEGAFIVISKAMRGTEEPETAGRWALHLLPCSITQANDAVAVIQGRAKASYPKKPKAAPAAPLTPHDIHNPTSKS